VKANPADAIDITVVIMAFDEVVTLPAVTKEIEGVLESLGRPYDILIIDDGSQDGTSEAADELARNGDRIRVAHHPVNSGLGGVYRTGFQEALGRFVTFFPADGQFPASIIELFRPEMETADLVLGYLPDRRDSLMGKVLSWIERLLYRTLLGPMPRFQGIMMFHKSLLDITPLASAGRGWGVVMEFIIRVSRGDAVVVSRPTVIRPRAVGVSKVNNTRTVLANLRQLFALRSVLKQGTPRIGQGSTSTPHARRRESRDTG
jgi:glycosyltransferase involved in cell wall biosynthesis